MRMPLLLVLMATSATACKDAVVTPTRPPLPVATPTPVTRIVLRDGANGQTVGELPIPAAGAVEANLPGYLPRRAMFRGADLYLWPQAEDYTTALIYTAVDGELYGMGRWMARTVTVGAPDDPRTLAAVRPAVEEAARASGLALPIVPGPGDITIEVNAGEFAHRGRAIAFAQYVSWSGLELRRARIVFRDNNDLVGSRKAVCGNTLLHELGHALGFFGHSIVGGEVMNAECSRRTEDHFSANERLALRMMYEHRRPGNLAPDTEWEARAREDARRPPAHVE